VLNILEGIEDLVTSSSPASESSVEKKKLKTRGPKQNVEDVKYTMNQHFFEFESVSNGNKNERAMVWELELSLELVKFFSKDMSGYDRYRVFDFIFTMDKRISQKLKIACKLTSLSICLNQVEVLDCVALWMKKEEKRNSMAVADAIVQDFLLLKPDGFEILQKTMKKCPRFSCVLISAACSYYDMKSSINEKENDEEHKQMVAKSWPMLDLLKLFYNIIDDELSVCYFISLKMDKLWRTVLKRTANPSDRVPASCFPPLAAWCVKSSFRQSRDDRSEYDRAAEKLLNACLRSMGHFAENFAGGKNESAKKEAVLWDRDEIEMLVNTVGQMVASCEDAGDVVNKLVQLVQVAMTSKVTDLTVDNLADLFDGIPKTRLLELVLKQKDEKEIEKMEVD